MAQKMSDYHTPVLLHDVIKGLEIKPNGCYVDVTYGGGGHSKEILKNLTTGRLYAFDQDLDARANIVDDNRLVFIDQNFRFLKNGLRLNGVRQIDGLLADLGVSSHQFDVPERGFSFRFEGPLDMRMDVKTDLTARQVLNEYSDDQLRTIFKIYGEISYTNRLVEKIITRRSWKAFEGTSDLVELLEDLKIPGHRKAKELAKVFQALRLEVNQEMEVLKEMLLACEKVIAPGGRLVVISYHSLEDRLVKNYIKKGSFEGKEEKDFYGNLIRPFKEINRKVIVPSDEEIKMNTRARSAKLRIAEKL